jgi:hypothetical protein
MAGENRLVTMTRDLRPWRAGQDAVVPAAKAAELIENGDAENPRPYPPPDVAPAVAVGDEPPPVLRRPRPYFTRKRG